MTANSVGSVEVAYWVNPETVVSNFCSSSTKSPSSGLSRGLRMMFGNIIFEDSSSLRGWAGLTSTVGFSLSPTGPSGVSPFPVELSVSGGLMGLGSKTSGSSTKLMLGSGKTTPVSSDWDELTSCLSVVRGTSVVVNSGKLEPIVVSSCSPSW